MKDKRRMVIVIAVLAVVAVVIGVAVVVFSKDDKFKDFEGIDLGNAYLDELEYDKALATFQNVLDIDPKNVEAYLGIVEVYIRTKDYETALKYAEEGYELTGDQRLKEKIDMIKSGNIKTSDGKKMRRTQYDGDGAVLWRQDYTYNREGLESKVECYNAEGTKIDEMDVLYNEDGKRIQSYSTLTSSGLVNKVENIYEDGLLVKTVSSDFEDDSKVTETRTKEYGENKKVIREDITRTEGENEYVIHEYDENGKNTKSTYYFESGEVVNVHLFTYDENGKRLSQEIYDGTGNLINKSVNEYDKDGNRIASKSYDGAGNLTGEAKYE